MSDPPIRALLDMRAATQAEVIERLERVLDQARRGEVCAFAIATVAPDLATGSSYALGDKTLPELLGSIRLMEHRIVRLAETGPID